MSQIQEIYFECLRCGQPIRMSNVPALNFQEKTFQVLDDAFYIEGRLIDDCEMVCHTIKRAKAKGPLTFNNIKYEVKDSILYIDGEEIGDYDLAIKAIKRTEKLSKGFSPLMCTNPACGRNGPFRILSQQEVDKIKKTEKLPKRKGELMAGRKKVHI